MKASIMLGKLGIYVFPPSAIQKGKYYDWPLSLDQAIKIVAPMSLAIKRWFVSFPFTTFKKVKIPSCPNSLKKSFIRITV